LRETFHRYQAACAAIKGLAPSSPTERASQDELRHARIALCEALASTGWEPPPDVVAQVLLDQRQLAEGRLLMAPEA
jgi:hypothetical protein